MPSQYRILRCLSCIHNIFMDKDMPWSWHWPARKEWFLNWMEIHFHSLWFRSKLLSVRWWNRRGLKFGCCSSFSPLISILSQSAADPVLPGHKLREREMVSRDSSTKVLPLLWPTILTPSLTRIYHQSSYTKNCCTNTSYWIIQHEYVQNYDKLQATSCTNHSQFTKIRILHHQL